MSGIYEKVGGDEASASSTSRTLCGAKQIAIVGCICLAVPLVPLAIFIIHTAYQWSMAYKSASLTKYEVPTAVENVDRHMLPLPRSSYPDALHGLLWMDQGGVYGHSTVPGGHGAPDLAFSFGDPKKTLDEDNRVIEVNITGPAWEWMNNAEGYHHFNANRASGYRFQFHWNEDYTFAEIWNCKNGDCQKICKGMSITIHRQKDPPEGICPPAKDASKEDVNKCAKFLRITQFNFMGINLPWPRYIYPVFQIADNSGKKLQPYFGAMEAYSLSRTKPNVTAAKENLIRVAKGQLLQKGTCLLGVAEWPNVDVKESHEHKTDS